jgi:hypothetical protein
LAHPSSTTAGSLARLSTGIPRKCRILRRPGTNRSPAPGFDALVSASDRAVRSRPLERQGGKETARDHRRGYLTHVVCHSGRRLRAYIRFAHVGISSHDALPSPRKSRIEFRMTVCRVGHTLGGYAWRADVRTNRETVSRSPYAEAVPSPCTFAFPNLNRCTCCLRSRP